MLPTVTALTLLIYFRAGLHSILMGVMGRFALQFSALYYPYTLTVL